MIEYLDVTKTYPGARGTAVDHVSLLVPEGELCVLLGPSGCGKTTLLRMTNRLVEPTSGQIRIDGRDILRQDPVELRRSIGYVIQSIGLFPHRTVAENVATTLELTGTPRPSIPGRVDELLAVMQLDPGTYRARYPHELSGGEQQRVGVARALAADPPLLLMDEPFGALDPVNRSEIQQQLLRLHRSLRKTILFVSHDISEAFLLADRIALMRDGKIVQFAEPAELVGQPANDFVERFLGSDRYLALLDRLDTAGAIDTSVDVPEPESGPGIAIDIPLRRALLALLESGRESLPVFDTDHRRLGSVTLASIQRSLARATSARDAE